MIRPALYFLAGLLAGPMTMFVRDPWLLAVGVAAALTALVVGIVVAIVASLMPRHRRRTQAVGGRVPPAPAHWPRKP